jgi:hypothetical protein
MTLNDWLLVALTVMLAEQLYRNRRINKRRLEQSALLAKTIKERVDAETVATLAMERAEMHRRRATEFFEVIQGIEKERDTWCALYKESSRGAGVAQAWLARDLARAIQMANVYGKRLREKGDPVPQIQPDPALAEVVRVFAETHPGAAEVPRAPGSAAVEGIEAKILQDADVSGRTAEPATPVTLPENLVPAEALRPNS